MPLRTVMNTQYRHGGGLRETVVKMQREGGAARFYRCVGRRVWQPRQRRVRDCSWHFPCAAARRVMRPTRCLPLPTPRPLQRPGPRAGAGAAEPLRRHGVQCVRTGAAGGRARARGGQDGARLRTGGHLPHRAGAGGYAQDDDAGRGRRGAGDPARQGGGARAERAVPRRAGVGSCDDGGPLAVVCDVQHAPGGGAAARRRRRDGQARAQRGCVVQRGGGGGGWRRTTGRVREAQVG